MISRRLCGLYLLPLFAALAAPACSSGGNTSVRCTRDEDCPVGQQCVGGNCQLPADEGPKPCTSSLECPVGQECRDGLCQPYGDEPDAGQPDGGDQVADQAGDLPTGDGDAAGTDQPADEDQRDFSSYHFQLVVAPGGRGASVAHQCLGPLTPEPDTGPRLPEATAAAPVRLGGLVRDGGAAVGGAEVALLGEEPHCLPAAQSTDGAGAFEFQLPAGQYLLAATAPGGVIGYDNVSLSAPTTRTINLPATSLLEGGPVFRDGPVDLNGWTVWAVFRSGSFTGQVAHTGVTTGPPLAAGMFSIPLADGFSYDLLGSPPAGQNFPQQVLYSDVTTSSNLLGTRVREGIQITGAVTVDGAGAAGCQLRVVRSDVPPIQSSVSTATGGLYQLLVRAGKHYQVDVEPSPAAFAQGALRYQDPDLFVQASDLVMDIELGQGQAVGVSGRLLDATGAPATGAQVWLRVQSAVMEAGSYPVCQAEPATVADDGSYLVTCNLDIP